MLASWKHSRLRPRLLPCVAAMLMLASSCQSTQRLGTSTNISTDVPAVNAHYSYEPEDSTEELHDSSSAAPGSSRIVQLSSEDEPQAPADESFWADDKPSIDEAESTTESSSFVTPGETADWSSPIKQVEHVTASTEPVSAPYCPPHDAAACPGEFLPADPRVTLPMGTPHAASCPLPYGNASTIPVPAYEPEVYPEEYICDGGDRGIRVYYDDFGRRGLDTEDTVAEFTDHTGLRCIRPSTRTCIYAPQFASVRTMSLSQVNLTIDKVAGTHDNRPTVGLRSHLTTGVELHNDQPIGIDRRSRASGLERKEVNSAIARVETASRHVKLNNVFENELFLSGVELDRTQEAYLAHAIQLAAAWTRNLNPVIVATDAGGQEVIATFHVEEYVGMEEPTKGDLKIIKVVDEPAAVPGDVVTFTIHYENIGERELYKIRIVDNLTPRLELLPETTESDREGHFTTEANGEGSIVLTFELAEPLPAKTPGTLTFQCRVR